MEKKGPEAKEYVRKRRFYALTEDELVKLIDSIQIDTAFISLCLFNNKTVMFVLPKGKGSPFVFEEEFSLEEWNQIVDDGLKSIS